MNPYSKTYRGFNQKALPKIRGRLIKITGIFVFDLLLSIILIIKKIFSLTLFKVLPIIGIIAYKIIFKAVLMPGYRILLNLNRKQKIIFLPNRSKLFFLFSNRYVAHTVAILIVVITILQNIHIQQSRAQELGHNSLFAKLTKDQALVEDITEEEIIIPEQQTSLPPKSIEELSPAVGQNITVGGQPHNTLQPTVLAQGGSAIIKPNIAKTFDTPRPRDKIITYTVQKKDTIFDIAERFRISVNTVLWANKLSSRSIIRPGDKLEILPVSGVKHIIKKNETISSIAAKYNIAQQDILDVNLLNAKDTVKIGLNLIIPDGRPLYTPAPKKRRRYIAKNIAPAASGGNMFWPTTCRRITQYFRGWRHTGIDIACGFGKNIYAAADGIVEKAGWNSGGYGNRIIIKHPNGTKTLYAHLKPQGILVAPGQTVKKGEVIGLAGSTGRSTGPHLHFEVIERGTRKNPFDWL
jgi:murein DD-endopeptidase MepM/ murein hydrolase activator NlpD